MLPRFKSSPKKQDLKTPKKSETKPRHTISSPFDQLGRSAKQQEDVRRLREEAEKRRKADMKRVLKGKKSQSKPLNDETIARLKERRKQEMERARQRGSKARQRELNNQARLAEQRQQQQQQQQKSKPESRSKSAFKSNTLQERQPLSDTATEIELRKQLSDRLGKYITNINDYPPGDKKKKLLNQALQSSKRNLTYDELKELNRYFRDMTHAHDILSINKVHEIYKNGKNSGTNITELLAK